MRYLRPLFPDFDIGDYVKFKDYEIEGPSDNVVPGVYRILNFSKSSQYSEFKRNPDKWYRDNPGEREPNYYAYEIGNKESTEWWENANKFIGVEDYEIDAIKYNL